MGLPSEGVCRTASVDWNLMGEARWQGLVDWKTARARAARRRFLGTWGGMVMCGRVTEVKGTKKRYGWATNKGWGSMAYKENGSVLFVGSSVHVS